MRIPHLAAGLFLLQAVPIFAQEDRPQGFLDIEAPMQFYSASNGGNCTGCGWIAAEGVITEDTPREFEDFLSKNSYRSTIYFNSTGGDLFAALEIGRIIRERRHNTNVGRTSFQLSGNWDDFDDQGVCLSACAYAFLGGVERYADPQDLGFHQFYSLPEDRTVLQSLEHGLGFSADQLIQGLIVAYIVDMGVDARLVTFASSSSSNTITTLDEETIHDLNVLTRPYTTSDWHLEPFAGGVIARVTREYLNGITNHFNVFCRSQHPQEPYLSIIHEWPLGTRIYRDYRTGIHSDVIVSFDNTDYLLIRQDEIASSVRLSTFIEDNEQSILFRLPTSLADNLRQTREISVGMDAFGFLGRTLGDMDFGGLRPAILDDRASRMVNIALDNCI